MAKRPSISTVSSGFLSQSTINNNFQNIAAKFDNTISRDGSTPNTMLADLDMNSNDIINVGTIYADSLFRIVDDIPTTFTSVSGILSQVSGGTGAASLGAGLLTPTGGSVARKLEDILGKILTTADIADPDTLVETAYASRSLVYLEADESAVLVCDPSSGDDLEDMVAWATSGHFVEQGAVISIEIADGLHEVSGFIPVTDNRFVSITGSAPPQSIEITGIAYGTVGSGLYTATVTVAEALPARVEAGFVVILQHPVADGIYQACSGAQVVDSVAGNRLSFVVTFRSHGRASTSITNTSTMDSGTTAGLTNNLVLIPYNTVQLTGGWVGSSNEGFFRVEQGGRLELRWVAFSYTGTGDANRELIFVSDGGSFTTTDYVAMVNAPKRIVRGGQGGKIYVNRLFATNVTGEEVTQVLSADANFIRSTLAGGSTSCVTYGAGTSNQSTSCVALGSPICLRTTGDGAMIRWDSSNIYWSDVGARPSAGLVSFNSSASRIEWCTDALGFAASAFRPKIQGLPTFANNANANIASRTKVDGGIWIDSPAADKDTPSCRYNAPQTHTFGSVPANSTVTRNFTCTGFIATDTLCWNLNSSTPAGLILQANISASNTVTVSVTNVTGSPITLGARTYTFLALYGTV